MGIFGFIKGKMNDLKEETETAKLEAIDRNDPRFTLWELSRLENDVHGMAKYKGYTIALRTMFRDKDISELREYYEDAYNARNVKALNALGAIIHDKGYECRDENGNWISPRDIPF